MINKINKHVIIQLSILLFLIFCVYSQMFSHEFINFDDPDYVTENKIVQNGITIDGIKWAFSFKDNDLTYWHPLTYVSHMIDCQFFNLKPGMHHLSSLLLHIINVMLLFLTLKKISGNQQGSLIATFLFALHPIGVDSIAWVAQRKTLLVTFFWLMTVYSYLRYIEKDGLRRYLVVCLFTILGLMTKPLMVTMPLILVIFDFWPNNRMVKMNIRFLRLILEKVPFIIFALMWASTIFIPKHVLAKNISFEEISLFLRIKNALVSYIIYLKQFLLSADFVIINPYPKTVSLISASISLGLILIVTVVFIKWMKKHPYLITGWMIFIITLIPFLGLVQGAVWPAHADRFAYVPFIGLYIITGMGISEIIEKFKINKTLYIITGYLMILILGTITYKQVAHWKNSEAVYRHAIVKTDKNYVAYNNLGTAYQSNGDTDKAFKNFFLALWAKPGYSKAFHNIAIAYLNQEKFNDAIDYFHLSLQSNPQNYIANYNLGNLYQKQGRVDEAIKYYEKTIENNPDFADSYNNIGVIHQNMGRNIKAGEYYKKAIERNPNHVNTLCNMGNILFDYKQIDDALMMFKQALYIDEKSIIALNGIAVCYIARESVYEAERYIEKMLSRDPGNSIAAGNKLIINKLTADFNYKYDALIKELHFLETGTTTADIKIYSVLLNIGNVCEKLGKYEEAKERYLYAASILTEKHDAFFKLAELFEEKYEFNNAIIYYNKAGDADPSIRSIAYYNIAGVFGQENNPVDSVKWLSKAVDDGFNNWEQIKSDYRFNSIRKTELFIEFLSVAGVR